jgi:hypothetical protein
MPRGRRGPGVGGLIARGPYMPVNTVVDMAGAQRCLSGVYT